MKPMEKKLDVIEKEITELKLMLMQQDAPKIKISLRGSLKGVKIDERTVEDAKKSLFKAGA